MDGTGLAVMRELLQAAQGMQEALQAVENELAAMTIEGTAAGGLVVAVFNGAGEMQAMRIAPEALAVEDPQWLPSQIVTAVRNAIDAVRETVDNRLAPILASASIDQGD